MFLLVFFAVLGVCHGEKSSFQKRADAFITEYISELYPHLADKMKLLKPLDDSRCPSNQVMNIDGTCSDVDVTQNIFVYGSPSAEAETKEELQAKYKPKLPRPKIEYNVLVIQKDETTEDPIIIPPPKEKTIVLVLKEEKDKKRKVIEVKPPQTKPEVLFVDYKEGENIQLPYGFDLNTVLSASTLQSGRLRNIGNIGSYGSLNGSNVNPWTTSSPMDEYELSFGQSYNFPKVKKEAPSNNKESSTILKVEPKSHEKTNYLSNHRNSSNSLREFPKNYQRSSSQVQSNIPKSIPSYNATKNLPPSYQKPLLSQAPALILKKHEPVTSESKQIQKIYQRPPETTNEYLKNHRTSSITPKEPTKLYQRPPPSTSRKSTNRSKQNKRTKARSKIHPKRDAVPQIHKTPQTEDKGTYFDLQNLELSKIKPQVYPDIPVFRKEDKKPSPPAAARSPTRLSEKKNIPVDKKSESLSTSTNYNNNYEKFSFVPSSRIISQGGEIVPQGWRRVSEGYDPPNTQANSIKRVNHSALYRLPNLPYEQR